MVCFYVYVNGLV